MFKHGEYFRPDSDSGNRQGLRFRDLGIGSRAFALGCASLAALGLGSLAAIKTWEHAQGTLNAFDPPEVPFGELCDGWKNRGAKFQVHSSSPDALHPSPRETVATVCWAEYRGEQQFTNEQGKASSRLLYSLSAERDPSTNGDFAVQLLVPQRFITAPKYASQISFANVELASATMPDLRLPTTLGDSAQVKVTIALPRHGFPTNAALGNFVGTNGVQLLPLSLQAAE